MNEVQPKYIREIEEILRRADIESKNHDDSLVSKIPVSEETKAVFFKVLDELSCSENEILREEAFFIRNLVENCRLRLYQAPEIINWENGISWYVHVGDAIYLWDENGGARIPKEQIVKAITMEAELRMNVEWI